MQSDPPIGLFASREVSSATMFAVIRVTRFFKFQSCFDNKSMRHSHSHFSLSNFDNAIKFLSESIGLEEIL